MRNSSCQNNRNIIRKSNVDLLKSLILQNSNNKTAIKLYCILSGEEKSLVNPTKMVYRAHLFLLSCYSIKARS